jgi:hypothetical protein
MPRRLSILELLTQVFLWTRIAQLALFRVEAQDGDEED